MRKTLFVVCLLTFSLLAQTKQKDHTKYFPLTEGSQWEYYWEAGKNTKGKIRISTSYIVKDVRKNYYEIERLIYNSNLGVSVLLNVTYTIRNQMLLETGSDGGVFGQPYKAYSNCPIVLKYPLKIGAKWDYEKDGGQKIFLKVIKWHDTLTTKYGVYEDVYEISEKTIDGEMTLFRFIYYAYGVGMVLEEISDNGTETGTRSPMNVLISYKVLD